MAPTVLATSDKLKGEELSLSSQGCRCSIAAGFYDYHSSIIRSPKSEVSWLSATAIFQS